MSFSRRTRLNDEKNPVPENREQGFSEQKERELSAKQRERERERERESIYNPLC